MRKTRTHCSEEFKTKAVALVIQRGNLLAVSRELNVSKGTLLLWKRNYESGILNSGGRSYEQEEITHLRKELKDAQLERDILKKAVSIFSKSGR